MMSCKSKVEALAQLPMHPPLIQESTGLHRSHWHRSHAIPKRKTCTLSIGSPGNTMNSVKTRGRSSRGTSTSFYRNQKGGGAAPFVLTLIAFVLPTSNGESQSEFHSRSVARLAPIVATVLAEADGNGRHLDSAKTAGLEHETRTRKKQKGREEGEGEGEKGGKSEDGYHGACHGAC